MKSIFKGKVVKEIYFFRPPISKELNTRQPFRESKDIDKISKTIDTPTFLTIDINPILNQGDNFYDHGHNKYYHIIKAMHGTDNTMVYFTDNIIQVVVDEKSKLKALHEKQVFELCKDKEEAETFVNQIKNHREYKLKKSWWCRIFMRLF